MNFCPAAALSAAAQIPSFSPATTYRLQHAELYRGGTCEPLACFVSPRWQVAGIECSGFRLVGAGRIHFERCATERSRTFGPFADIRVEAGLIWVAAWQRFASFQHRTRVWHAFALGANWPVMVLTAVPREPEELFERHFQTLRVRPRGRSGPAVFAAKTRRHSREQSTTSGS